MEENNVPQTNPQKELCVICEGGIHTAEYLYRNGVIPSKVVLNLESFKEALPTFTGEVEFLCIIRGMIDFTYAGFYALMRDYYAMKGSYENFTVISNLELGNVDFPYYLYSGDLFYGSVVEVFKGKRTPVVAEGDSKKTAKKKGGKKSSSSVEDMIINPVMSRFKVYTGSKNPIGVFGAELREPPKPDPALKQYFTAVKVVDYFK